MNRFVPHRTHRRGLAAMMAMLFLVLISTLAIGFYAMTNASVQVVHNEERAGNALLAAESGMGFIRHHLANVDIPYNATPSQLFHELTHDLSDRLDGTPNLNGGNIYADATQIRVPASGFMKLDNSGRQVRIEINNLGQKVKVKVVGKYGVESARGVQLEYGLAENASQIFDYGVASRGKVSTGGSSKIRGATDPKKGSVLSTTMTDPTPVYISGKEVSGDISITNPAGNIVINGATVGGETSSTGIAKHLHKGVPEPEFPTINTDVFAKFIENTYNPASPTTNFVNMRIPANSNLKFTGKVNVTGVLMIEAPNNIEFRGGVDITGLIVVSNEAMTAGTLASNILDFSGNVSSYPVSMLPSDPKWDELRKLTGSFILAPNFHTKFSGSFGTVNGSIISSKVSMTGNAGGTVLGSVLNLNDTALTLNGSSEIIIASTGTTDYPAGVYFSSHYTPLKDTYREVKAE